MDTNRTKYRDFFLPSNLVIQILKDDLLFLFKSSNFSSFKFTSQLLDPSMENIKSQKII